MQNNVGDDVFLQGLQALGFVDPQQFYPSFLRYREELLDWNTRINLTAITNPDDVLIKHFLDSLSLLQAYDQPGIRLLDIGSGPGFPGLPLKIVRPDWQVTLLEATGKKTTFLQHMVDLLALKDITVLHGRAEEFAHKKQYRAQFDLVTARAVSALPTLLEYCAPYCRPGGSILLPKKGDLAAELFQGEQAAAILGTAFQADILVDLPGLHDGRRILVWQQKKASPPIYPRSGAIMAKKPLGSSAAKKTE